MPLNDLQCRHAKPQPKKYRLFDAAGLYLEVMPNGSKYWRYKYRFDGKEKRLAIGVYPDVSLMEARKLQEAAQNQKKQGFDPVILKAASKQQAIYNRAQTLEAVAREWYAIQKPKWKPNFAKEVLRRLENNLFQSLGKFPVRQLATADLYDCLKRIEKRSPHMARRCGQYLSQIMCFAVQTGRAERDITIELKGAITVPKTTHRASFEIDALPSFLKTLEERKAELSVIVYLAIRIMLKTFVRRSELMAARWCEFDFARAMWTIPAENMKMKREHLVPLSRQTTADLMALRRITGNSEYLFPRLIKLGERMDKSVIMQGLKTLNYEGKMSCHGFRALAMGICKERLNYRHEIPDRQLAHLPKSQIDQAYDRAMFLPDRIEMMQRYADYLDNPTQQPKPIQRTPAYDYRPQPAKYAPITYSGIATTFGILAPAIRPEVS